MVSDKESELRDERSWRKKQGPGRSGSYYVRGGGQRATNQPFSLSVDYLRTVLAVKVCFAAPVGAPLTAAGRSERHLPIRRKRVERQNNPLTPGCALIYGRF
jgi:hypothetical protein